MSDSSVAKVSLYDVEAGDFVQAQLHSNIEPRNISDWETLWLPMVVPVRQRLAALGIPLSQGPQSGHWRWNQKVQEMLPLHAKKSFTVMLGGITQGMMIADLVSHKCEILSQKNKDLVYIEYAESAPWNQGGKWYPPKRYKLVGSVLVGAAINLSIQEGLRGRIGLHALPQANDFYLKCGMTDLGFDTAKKMNYFEMTEAQAITFNS